MVFALKNISLLKLQKYKLKKVRNTKVCDQRICNKFKYLLQHCSVQIIFYSISFLQTKEDKFLAE